MRLIAERAERRKQREKEKRRRRRIEAVRRALSLLIFLLVLKSFIGRVRHAVSRD